LLRRPNILFIRSPGLPFYEVQQEGRSYTFYAIANEKIFNFQNGNSRWAGGHNDSPQLSKLQVKHCSSELLTDSNCVWRFCI